MENFFTRYKNPLVLMAVLFVQVIALATQVKRAEDPHAPDSGGTRLIRVWTVTAITPFERAFVATGHFLRNTWHSYVDLRHVRRDNRDLQAEVDRLRMQELKLQQDADQARRLQVLLGFKQKYIGQTLAAQVIGSSGSEESRVIFLDKGSRDGVRPDMPVITPDGIVGKIKEVFPLSSQVLLINDRDSGAGVLFESSRLQGTIHGTSMGQLQVDYMMSDERINVGERVLTSGGDRIYPKGLPVGTVSSVAPDRDNEPFLAVTVKPAADLNRLEEVLIVTKVAEETPSLAGTPPPVRAADILAERLPGLPKQPPKKELKPGEKLPAGASPSTQPAAGNPAANAEGAAGVTPAPVHVQPPSGAAAAGPGAAAVKHVPATQEGATASKPAAGGAAAGTTAPSSSAPHTAAPGTTPGVATPHSTSTAPASHPGAAQPANPPPAKPISRGTQPPPAHATQGPGNTQPAAPHTPAQQPGNAQPRGERPPANPQTTPTGAQQPPRQTPPSPPRTENPPR